MLILDYGSHDSVGLEMCVVCNFIVIVLWLEMNARIFEETVQEGFWEKIFLLTSFLVLYLLLETDWFFHCRRLEDYICSLRNIVLLLFRFGGILVPLLLFYFLKYYEFNIVGIAKEKAPIPHMNLPVKRN